MKVATKADLRRSRAARFAMLLWGFVALVAALHVLVLFFGITIGGEASSRVLVLLLSALGLDRSVDLWSYSAMRFLCLLALPAIGGLAIKSYRNSGPTTGLLTLATLTVPLVLALSYRFPALVAAAGFAYAQHKAKQGAPPHRAWLWLGAVLLLSAVPIDVSLRTRPMGPRLAPTLEGLLTEYASLLDDSGEVVVVGACNAIYDAPRWVWVW